MGRRSRRKVDAVIGVALVLGLIGSEMRPDGGIVGGKTPSVLEKTDAEMQIAEEGSVNSLVDQTLVEELGRIQGLDDNIIAEQKGSVVLPMPTPTVAVRPDHCYSSFLGKDVKQEPALLWGQLPPSPLPEEHNSIQHYPITDAQYLPSAYELLHERMGIGDHRQSDLQAELADLVAAVRPSTSGGQSPLSFSSGIAATNPEDLLNDILNENEKMTAFDNNMPPFSPKMDSVLMDDPISSFLDPTQDIFRWMEQSSFELNNECAASSHASDLFHAPAQDLTVAKDLPAADSTDRTIDELLHALESDDKSMPFGLTTSSVSDECDPFFAAASGGCEMVNVNATRKRKSEYSTSSWSSGASSSSKSGFEPYVSDFHNHTYDDGAAERRANKAARVRSGTTSDEGSNGGNVRCRDIADFADLNIPYTYEAVISAEPSHFNTMVGDTRLNDAQRTLMRAARRRAKNRNAARQCRQRRVDEVEDLNDEVEGLEDERSQLLADVEQIDSEIAAQKAANERLQAFIIEAYTRQRPPSMSDAEYRLQTNRNGSFTLVEQRGIRA